MAHLTSWAEVAEIMSRVTGKTVSYMQIPEAVFTNFFSEEDRKRNYTNMYKLIEDSGYYGKTVKLKEEMRSELADLDTFLKEENFTL